MNISNKQKMLGVLVLIGVLLVVAFMVYGMKGSPSEQKSTSEGQNGGEIKLLGTNPSPINDITVLPNQTLEFTFNKELVNDTTRRIVIEPELDYRIELSSDRKTAKIIPNKPFELGQDYNISIKSELKFEGDKKLGHEENFHFKTINYSGV